MKKKLVKAGILTVVFIVAIIVSSILTNRNTVDMTMAMKDPTLPTIIFDAYGHELNPLVGYTKEMSIPAMRDTITPLDKQGNVDALVQTYGETIKRFAYAVYSLDGEKVLLEKEETKVQEKNTLVLGGCLQSDAEAVLKITLITDDEKEIYYYTRIAKADNYNVKECVSFAKEFQEKAFEKEENQIAKYLEPDGQANERTLQHVTIHSDVSQVIWGGLHPEATGEIKCELKETNEVYNSILLKYNIQCMGDNEEEIYEVKEFFKVRKYGDRFYLLVYDRTMEQVFSAEETVITTKGVDLGIVPTDVPYRVSSGGDLVAFVQSRELWMYDRKDDLLTQAFGFRKAEKVDERNHYNQHDVKIVSMDKNGNITFMVYGYMNRGNHEGEVGVAFYYYDHSYKTVEEKVFIASDKAYAVAADELCKMVYYQEQDDMLYLLSEGKLISIAVQEGEQEVLAENLSKDRYVVSPDGNIFACQKDGNLYTATEIEVRDFALGTVEKIVAEAGDSIRPLGFVGEDFICGYMKKNHEAKTIGGMKLLPMYKLEIRDKRNEVVKEYREKGVYISDIFVDDNMVTLKRVKKSSGRYKDFSEDYITNNEASEENSISLEQYVTSLKQQQYRLAFAEGISDVTPRIVYAKQLVVEELPVQTLKSSAEENHFYVYGAGEMQGVFDKAGYAVQMADEIEGVVVSSNQTYVWERGNQEAWYRIAGINSSYKKAGETSLDACLRVLLAYEKVTGAKTQGLTPFEVLEKYSGGEVLDLTGVEVENLRYSIGKDTPILAMTGENSAVLLIGYQGNVIIYMDPSDGKIKTNSMKGISQMTAGSGHTYLGYAKPQQY